MLYYNLVTTVDIQHRTGKLLRKTFKTISSVLRFYRAMLLQSALLPLQVVCLSVCLSVYDG